MAPKAVSMARAAGEGVPAGYVEEAGRSQSASMAVQNTPPATQTDYDKLARRDHRPGAGSRHLLVYVAIGARGGDRTYEHPTHPEGDPAP